MRTFITRDFLSRIVDSGQLAEASRRLSRPEGYQPLSHMSTWSLICEEVVDTQYEDAYYERVVAELYRRGLTADEVKVMRIFAWETAGWLNFEKMAWDWCSLDETDIERAISLRLEEKDIIPTEASTMRDFLARYAGEKKATKAAQPGATDNPDNAQRLREDY